MNSPVHFVCLVRLCIVRVVISILLSLLVLSIGRSSKLSKLRSWCSIVSCAWGNRNATWSGIRHSRERFTNLEQVQIAWTWHAHLVVFANSPAYLRNWFLVSTICLREFDIFQNLEERTLCNNVLYATNFSRVPFRGAFIAAHYPSYK